MISFDEFLNALKVQAVTNLVQKDMNEMRSSAIKQAFQLLDEEGKGCIPIDFLLKKFNPDGHPRVRTREKTAEDVMKDFEAAIKRQV